MTPDFDQIAASLIMRASANNDVPPGTWHVTANAIAEQLRQVWNARGAADLAMINEMLGTSRTGFDNRVDQTLRSLDR